RARKKQSAQKPSQTSRLFPSPECCKFRRNDLLGSGQHSPEITHEKQTASQHNRFFGQAVSCPTNFPKRVTAKHVVLATVGKLNRELVELRGALLTMVNQDPLGINPGL